MKEHRTRVMKTNQEMTRPMGKFNVIQRTKDGFFSATDLMKQWNSHSGQKKNINHYLENSSTNEFIKAVIEDDEMIRNSEKPMNHVVIKEKCKTKKNGEKEPGAVWMSPIVFIDFAMWLNPAFKVKVLKFVSDEMIRYRNEAGDAYKEMSFQVQSISPAGVPFPDVIRGVSKAVNIVVYGKHERMIRNKVGEEGKVRELLELERDIAKMIKRKFIKNLVELRAFLLQEYRERHEPSLLIA